MRFNKHSEIEGKHAFLSASKYHWVRYSPARMAEVFHGYFAAEEGSKKHAFAAECIRMKQKLARKKDTLNMYVNDAVDFGMTAEQPLYYSRNCFGTTDAILFENGFLRIHDYKSGSIPAHEEQLYIYAALFCLEYDVDPEDIQMELRIYQNCQILIYTPSAQTIRDVMDKIVEFDNLIEEIRTEEESA
jgi:hypothetical protein